MVQTRVPGRFRSVFKSHAGLLYLGLLCVEVLVAPGSFPFIPDALRLRSIGLALSEQCRIRAESHGLADFQQASMDLDPGALDRLSLVAPARPGIDRTP